MAKNNNLKKFGWESLFVVMSSDRLCVYRSSDQRDGEPMLAVRLSEMHHIRPVTHLDVIHAKEEDIPLIFQVCRQRAFISMLTIHS